MDISKSLLCVFLISISILCSSCAQICPVTCNNTMTDHDIVTNVQTRLAGDRGLSVQNIHVYSYERNVLLTGAVENPSQACAAVALARTVPHVRTIKSKIQIKNPVDFAT